MTALALPGIAAHAQLGPTQVNNGPRRVSQPVIRSGAEAKMDKHSTVSWMTSQPLLKATTVDAFIEALPIWGEEVPREGNDTKTQNLGESEETVDGRGYHVSRTKYSITDTPDEIVTFQPVNGFWLGGLVQQEGMTLGIGSMQEVPIPAEKRAAFKVATDLPMSSNFQLIPSPCASAVSSALGDLMQKGNNIQWGGARTLKIVENYNEQQTAQNLGLSARYLTANVNASLQSARHQSKHTITAAFIERAFTATADFEGRSRRAAFFSNAFTIGDARDLVNQKRIAMSNLPAYIKSVTYGRVVLFNLTSSLSEEEMKTALGVSFEAGFAAGKVNINTSDKMKTASFELRVTEFGGPQNGFSKLIPANGITNVLQVMNSYLQQPAPLSTMMPISYTVNTLRDDQLAAMSQTTSYTVTKYVSNPIGERYKIQMWVTVTGSDDGVADNTVECYGALRVNGDVWWEILREESDAIKREAGQDLALSDDTGAHRKKDFTFDYFYNEKTPFVMDLRIRDSDSGSADDDLGIYQFTFDLKQMEGKISEWPWRKGKESTLLHMKVTRVDYL